MKISDPNLDHNFSPFYFTSPEVIEVKICTDRQIESLFSGGFMSVLLYVHQKRENFSPSLFFFLLQGSTPLSLSSMFVAAAFTSDVKSQLNSRERGGASDSKNPNPYYLRALVFRPEVYHRQSLFA